MSKVKELKTKIEALAVKLTDAREVYDAACEAYSDAIRAGTEAAALEAIEERDKAKRQVTVYEDIIADLEGAIPKAEQEDAVPLLEEAAQAEAEAAEEVGARFNDVLSLCMKLNAQVGAFDAASRAQVAAALKAGRLAELAGDDDYRPEKSIPAVSMAGVKVLEGSPVWSAILEGRSRLVGRSAVSGKIEVPLPAVSQSRHPLAVDRPDAPKLDFSNIRR